MEKMGNYELKGKKKKIPMLCSIKLTLEVAVSIYHITFKFLKRWVINVYLQLSLAFGSRKCLYSE